MKNCVFFLFVLKGYIILTFCCVDQNEERQKFEKPKRKYNGTYGRMLSLAAHALAEVSKCSLHHKPILSFLSPVTLFRHYDF